MAKRATKERPYHCQLCQRALAEDEVGFICEHVAHGTMLTFVADAPSKREPLPDTACTSCMLAMDQKKKNAEEDANIHVVCEPCFKAARARSIDYFTKADRKRGYVLVPRTHYDRVWKREKPLVIGPIREGRVLKLGFSPIPSTYPIALERMWVRVTCVLPRGEIHGLLANDPTLFAKKVLKPDDTIVFGLPQVLEIEDQPKAATKKKATPKKKAATKKSAAPKKKAAAKKPSKRAKR